MTSLILYSDYTKYYNLSFCDTDNILISLRLVRELQKHWI